MAIPKNELLSDLVVLFIDDDKNILLAGNELLKLYVKKVYTASDGDDGLEVFKQYSDIDIIISDVKMENLNGLEMASQIRAINKNIPIILMTAFTDEDYLMRAIEIGINKYILKPMSASKLLNAIEDVAKPIKLEKKNHDLEAQVAEETQKRLEKERMLFEQSKMATMGEMMSNIAHQWRQPLSAIVNIVSYIDMKSTNDILTKEELKHELNNIAESSIFLSDTINTFRDFFRNDKSVVEYDLSQAINTTISIVNHALKNHNIIINKNILENINMKSYQQDLQHAILNIINNAKDVLLEKNDLKNRIIFIDTIDNNDTVQIKIRDNGGGIPEKVKNKVFEPYFTTKHQSQGTGIGLYMTYQIVVINMQGAISVSNVEYDYNDTRYVGAEFVIEVPKILQKRL